MKNNEILEPTKKQENPQPKDIKILGVVSNMNNSNETFYVATDGADYFLFTGEKCCSPSSFFTDYDDM